MIDFTDVNEVKGLQSNIHIVFNTPAGKEVLAFLEEACGWYESIFDPDSKDRIMINAGRREVVATIKTLLKHSPEHIVQVAQQKEQSNG